MAIGKTRDFYRRRRRARIAVLAAVGQVAVVGAMLLLLPSKACPDELIKVGQLCPSGHQYEPLRLAGADGEPTWVSLCYKGKDGKAAVARACASRACLMDGLRTLDESVKEGNHVAPCAIDDVGCVLWDIYIFHQITGGLR